MKKLILASLAVVGLVAVAAATIPAVSPAKAVNPYGACGANSDSAICKGQDESLSEKIVKPTINIILWVVGVSAVIVIIVAGLKYVTSAGNPSAISSAKTTILYAVIGLVIAILAYAIVNFVLNSFSGDGFGSKAGPSAR